MGAFLETLYETLIYSIFWLAYPVSLYFLYEKDKMISFYLVSVIVFLSIIYFFSYYAFKLSEKKIIVLYVLLYLNKYYIV